MSVKLQESFTLIGVKPNSSYFHNTMRIVVLFILMIVLVMIYLADNAPYQKKVSIDDIQNVAKPGTKMYDMIMDMDERERVVYVSALGKILDDVEHLSRMRQILKTVFAALIVGFVAEYIIHGNIVKTASITGKTALSSALMTMV